MKRAMCAILFLGSACFGQSARDYYNELYKGRGTGQMGRSIRLLCRRS